MTTTLRARWDRWRRSVDGGADRGTTLLELTVGMALLAVFMVLFTGAMVSMFSAVRTTQTVTTTAAQVNTAFTTLDETIRPAAYISTPGTSATSGNWYVELRYTYSGSETCTQLRVDKASQQLQSRSWAVTAAGAGAAGAWKPIASRIANGAATAGTRSQPFVLAATTGSRQSQQLTVTLVPPGGPGTSSDTAGSQFSVTALNSTLPVPTGSICQQQGRP